MDGSQLSVLAYKYLKSQHSIKIGNVDEVEVGGHVSFICKNSRESKPWLE